MRNLSLAEQPKGRLEEENSEEEEEAWSGGGHGREGGQLLHQLAVLPPLAGAHPTSQQLPGTSSRQACLGRDPPGDRAPALRRLRKVGVSVLIVQGGKPGAP